MVEQLSPQSGPQLESERKINRQQTIRRFHGRTLLVVSVARTLSLLLVSLWSVTIQPGVHGDFLPTSNVLSGGLFVSTSPEVYQSSTG